MRDQYAGDVSDAVKFGFLRALAGTDRRLGVAWYYAPGHDGGSDGRHVSWMSEASWQGLDTDVHAGLSTLPARSIKALEAAPFWPAGTAFHRDPVPGQGRQAWADRMQDELAAADLVFLDPDNGIGDDDSPKHASMAEIAGLLGDGRTLVLITFPGRTRHAEQVRDLHTSLIDGAGAKSAVTMRISVSVPRASSSPFTVPTFRWLTVLDADGELVNRTMRFADALKMIRQVKVEVDRAQ